MKLPPSGPSRESLSPVDHLHKTNSIDSARATKPPVNHAELVIITLSNDGPQIETETEILLQATNSYKINTEIVLVDVDDGSDLNEKIQRLHSESRLGPDTQVIVRMHGGIDHGIHKLGGNKAFIGTVELLRLLRSSGEDFLDSWQGLVHFDCCWSAVASDELSSQSEGSFKALGSCIFYGGHKEKFTTDGFDVLLEIVRLIGRDCELRKADSTHAGISRAELFHHAASISGESVTLIDNGVSQRSKPSSPLIGVLQLNNEQIEAQVVRALHARLDHSSFDKAEQLLAKSSSAVIEKTWNKKRPIHMAVGSKLDPIKKIQALLKAGANINSQDEYGNTALHSAAEAADSHVLKFLIDNGADLNAKDENNLSPIHCAIAAKKSDNVKALIEMGANIDAQNGFGATALHNASSKGNAELVTYLIDAGANQTIVDSYGYRAIDHAIIKNNTEIVILLIKSGSDINLMSEEIGSPACFAIRAGNKEMIEAMIKYGNIDFTQNDKDGMNIFSTACFKFSADIVKKMLIHGADPIKAGPNGIMPIAIPVLTGQIEILSTLLTFPNPLELEPSLINTLLVLSRDQKQVKMTEFLEKFRDDGIV